MTLIFFLLLIRRDSKIAVLIAFKTRSKMAKNLQIPSETLFSFGVMMKRSAISL